MSIPKEKTILCLIQASCIAVALATTLPASSQPGEIPSKKDSAPALAPGQAEIMDFQVPEGDIFAGEGLSLNVSVENSGDKPLGRFRIVLLESNQVLSDKVYFVRLEPHANKAVRIAWSPKQAKRYQLRAVILAEGQPISPKLLSSKGTPTSVEVLEQPQSKLQFSQITPDAAVQNGQPCHIKVSIKNTGEMEASRIKISLEADHGRAASHRVDRLAAGATYEAELEWTPRRQGKAQLILGLEAAGNSTRSFKRIEKRIDVEVR